MKDNKVTSMTEARKIREKLGVDQNVLLAPQKPEPKVIQSSPMDVLSHTGIFSFGDCAKIIADNEPEDWNTACMNGKGDDQRVDTTYRNSNNVWLTREEKNLQVFDKMLALVMGANNHKYQFEVDYFEALQLAKYDEGMHYNWHYDIGSGHAGNRKLSVTVQLSDPAYYEGGDLILDIGSREPFVKILQILRPSR